MPTAPILPVVDFTYPQRSALITIVSAAGVTFFGSLLITLLVLREHWLVRTGQRAVFALQALLIVVACICWVEDRPSEWLIRFAVPITIAGGLIGPSDFRGVFALSCAAVLVVTVLSLTAHPY